MKLRKFLVAIATVGALALAGCGSSPSPKDSGTAAPSTRSVTDMAGRTVEVPGEIDRIVTIGSVPVINSFLFALGDGNLIVNGLPDFAANPRWRYQYVFSPQIENLPQTQTADRAPDVEQILNADPDLILTMSESDLEIIESTGIPAMVLSWRDAEDVKAVVDILGQALGQESQAQAYSTYFDDALAQVGTVVDPIPEAERQTVLYLSPEAMTRPHLIAEWWIDQAGGISVTRDEPAEETLSLNVEQIIAWDPQVIFVSSPDSREQLMSDQQLADVSAVRTGQVYSIPIAAHTWGNRTSEQPLTVMWAASKLYPDQMADFDLPGSVKDFYSQIYQTDLSDDQVTEILEGF